MDTRKLNIVFSEDSRETLRALPAKIPQLLNILDHTVIPLAEAAVLTLFQQSTQYKRTSLTTNLKPDASGLTFKIVYNAPSFVGSDIEQTDVAHDVDVIKQRVGQGCQLRNVSIDTKTGAITIEGDING